MTYRGAYTNPARVSFSSRRKAKSKVDQVAALQASMPDQHPTYPETRLNRSSEFHAAAQQQRDDDREREDKYFERLDTW